MSSPRIRQGLNTLSKYLLFEGARKEKKRTHRFRTRFVLKLAIIYDSIGQFFGFRWAPLFLVCLCLGSTKPSNDLNNATVPTFSCFAQGQGSHLWMKMWQLNRYSALFLLHSTKDGKIYWSCTEFFFSFLFRFFRTLNTLLLKSMVFLKNLPSVDFWLQLIS